MKRKITKVEDATSDRRHNMTVQGQRNTAIGERMRREAERAERKWRREFSIGADLQLVTEPKKNRKHRRKRRRITQQQRAQFARLKAIKEQLGESAE